MRSQETSDSPGVGVTDSCELPDMGARNPSGVFMKGSEPLKPFLQHQEPLAFITE